MSHVEGTGMNSVACKNPIILGRLIVSYAPLSVGVNGLRHWHSIGGRRSHLHRPVILLHHTVKIVSPSYFTYVVYLYSVTVQPESHRGLRPRILFIRPGIVAYFLKFTGSLLSILR